MPHSPRRFYSIVMVVLFVCYSYSIFRYHYVKGYPIDQFWLFVNNKALSLVALILLLLAALGSLAARRLWPGWITLKTMRRELGLLGFYLALWHALASFVVLNSAYFGKFFAEDGKLLGRLEASITFGALTMAALTYQALRSESASGWKPFNRLGFRPGQVSLAVFVALFLHMLFMDYPRWLKPDQWGNYIPPIKLISGVLAFSGIVICLIPAKGRGSKTDDTDHAPA